MIRDLCDNYLSYVKDLGFNVDVIPNGDVEVVVIYRGGLIDENLFNFSELESDIIAFTSLLKELGLKFTIGYDGLVSSKSADVMELIGQSLYILIIGVSVK